jgi:drug/metabolite transporter (DMT)-like permease
MNGSRGFVFVLLAAFFWGISATYAKLVLTDHVSTTLLVQVRVTFSLIILVSYFLLTNPRLLTIRMHDIWKFVLVGVVGVAGSNFMYYFALREGTVASAILLQYTAPIMTIAFAVMAGQEKMTAAKALGGSLSLVGIAMAVGGDGGSLTGQPASAFLSGIAAACCFAFFTIATKRLLLRYRVWTVTIYALLFASMFWIVVHPPWDIMQENPSGETWIGLIIFALTSILLPYTMYFAGLQRIEASRAIIASTCEPIVAIGSAALFLNEHLQPIQFLGAICVIGAIFVVRERKVRKPSVVDAGGDHATQ